ncbi:glycosyltransferase family 4 protein [Caldimonas tepidiphila]|uniref:glycosyltransferase family 4 protein n=1 Tax=Caldimonas tepidiphila TaxID=2315841 RepID=UPI000E5A631A|nr:glycosyltransferase family 4 protein [Caldimonas tepidiphila]
MKPLSPPTAPRAAAAVPQGPRVAVFDQAVSARSPAGSCVMAQVAGLAARHRVTVFSDRCELAGEPGVEWVRVPLPRGPVLLRYLLFQAAAPFLYGFWRLRGHRADWVQTTQGQFARADVVYAHFCHRAYLKGPWKSSPVRGLRRAARWCNHAFNAFFERRALARASRIVVPSLGLARELAREYPGTSARLVTIPNPVDADHFAMPAGFDRAAQRLDAGLREDALVFAFMALGDFARKGLPLVLEGLAGLPEALRAQAQVLVIGGGPDEIEEFSRRAEALGLDGAVRFAGLQQDVRPWLWCADVFAFPSAYEVFSLAILQAAAAGLPVLTSQGLYGAEEFVRPGVNGWLVERNAGAVGSALAEAILGRERLPALAQGACESVRRYSREAFVARWSRVYADLGRWSVRWGEG